MPRTDKSTQPAFEAEGALPMFYRMRDVLRMTALSLSTLYRRIANGTFPESVSLGEQQRAGAEAISRTGSRIHPASS
ncbi:MAG: helix-turn-helix transcriptional regulator [Burkholderiaceae bacterium]